jgi:hypothetical protein
MEVSHESDKRKYIKEKLERVTDGARKILKILVLEDPKKFAGRADLNSWVIRRMGLHLAFLQELIEHNFLINIVESEGSRTLNYIQLNESYRKCLEELLWEG